MSRNFILNTNKNEIIRITAYGEKFIGKYPCIIIVHGFKGFKDWGFFPYSAEYLSKNKFFVLTFNFSHNGIGENIYEFTEFDKFASNTFSLEIAELKELINSYFENFFGEVKNQPIGLLGHSRGGAISLLTSLLEKRIKAIATWNSVSTFDRYSNRQKEEMKKNGFILLLNSRTKQNMKVNISLLEDLEKNINSSLNIINAVKNFQKPLLIAHGTEDLTVRIKEAEFLYENSNKNFTELFRVEKAGHTFGIVHPFNGSNSVFENLLLKTKDFFIKNLYQR